MNIIGRKSRNTDQALIKAGIELIAQGNYDPTVRAICTLANVNQGMFVYYFGFKEEYMKVLFQKIYEDYLSKLQDYPEKDAKAAIQLQQIFYRMTKYFIENFNTANFLTEALYHSKAASYFTNYRVQHFIFVRTLIEQAQREGDICSDMNSYEIYTTLQSILIQPIIIKNNILQQHKNEPLMDKLKLIDVSSESSLQKRLRVAFKGLRP